MTLPVTLRVEARADFDAAFDWYEAQRPGLGGRFAERVQQVVDRIADSPGLYPRVLRNVRRAVIRQFPYILVYEVEPQRIVVLSILHGSRNPDLWRERL